MYNPINDLWCAGIKRVDHKFNEVIESLSTVRHDQSKSTVKSSNATCSKPLGSPPTEVAAP